MKNFTANIRIFLKVQLISKVKIIIFAALYYIKKEK